MTKVVYHKSLRMSIPFAKGSLDSTAATSLSRKLAAPYGHLPTGLGNPALAIPQNGVPAGLSSRVLVTPCDLPPLSSYSPVPPGLGSPVFAAPYEAAPTGLGTRVLAAPEGRTPPASAHCPPVTTAASL